MEIKNSRLIFYIILSFSILLLCLASGERWLSPGTLFDLASRRIAGVAPSPEHLLEERVLFAIRLPRVALGLLVGGALALGGVILQNILNNPLADPFLLGISSGAGLGAAFVICLLGMSGPWSPTFGAFLGAILTSIVVGAAGRSSGRFYGDRLLLAGIAINTLQSTCISLLLYFSNQRDRVIFYLMGSLDSYYGPATLSLFFLLMGGCLWFTWGRASAMNFLSLGERKGESLGVHVPRFKTELFAVTAIAVSIAVSFGGIIGFVGLFIPHVVRQLFGFDHRQVVPIACWFGGLFLVVCDTFARSLLATGEVPVGIFTALLGCPYFLFLLSRQKKRLVE